MLLFTLHYIMLLYFFIYMNLYFLQLGLNSASRIRIPFYNPAPRTQYVKPINLKLLRTDYTYTIFIFLSHNAAGLFLGFTFTLGPFGLLPYCFINVPCCILLFGVVIIGDIVLSLKRDKILCCR